MRRRGAPASALLATLLTLAPAGTPAGEAGPRAPAPPELLLGFTLIDGTGAPPVTDAALVMRDGWIRDAGSRRTVEARWRDSADVVRVELGGAYVIPGLIDAHVHLATAPDRARAEAELERLLHAGVTSVRDMAGDARALASLARDSRLGEIPAPDVYFSALMAGPTFFEDPRPAASAAGETPGAVPWMQAVTPGTDVRAAVLRAAGTYAAGIKIYADLAAPEVARITREAHRKGLRVWAHSMVFPARPLEVVQAGVDVVSHVCRLAWEGVADAPQRYHHQRRPDYRRLRPDAPVFRRLFQEMRDRGVLLDATLAMYARRARARAGAPPPPSGTTPRRPECDVAFARALTRQAHGAGVELVAGTDFSTPPTEPPALLLELEELVEHGGLTPADALVAATRNGARAIGIQDRAGTLEAGKRAHFVVLDADPLADIRHLRRVREVWKGGERFAAPAG